MNIKVGGIGADIHIAILVGYQQNLHWQADIFELHGCAFSSIVNDYDLMSHIKAAM